MTKDDNKRKHDNLHFSNSQEVLFALQMYMSRFMWISTKEIVSGISSCYYNDTKGIRKIKELFQVTPE